MDSDLQELFISDSRIPELLQEKLRENFFCFVFQAGSYCHSHHINIPEIPYLPEIDLGTLEYILSDYTGEGFVPYVWRAKLIIFCL